MRRANDPQRREKIIQATLEAVKLYGIHAVQAITDMIYSSQVATPDNMELMYQLYALASQKPLLKTVMQNWMQRSQQTLEQWFEPGTARALDAFIEGMTLHFVTDRKPLSREEILRMVERVAG
ncbi:DeoR family transcriptional regulator [Escherichia coli]|nr:DeoR family transcriptional regulator [Escherichia coli]HCB8333358.1 hypothetical protein [Escherichia coli]